MKTQFKLAALLIACAAWAARLEAAVVELDAPGDIVGGTTLRFDEVSAGTVLNSRYYGTLGIQFLRPDEQAVTASDYVEIGRTTSSGRNVLSTSFVPGVNSSYSTSLSALTTVPQFAVGAYWGNDRGNSDFTAMRLSIFDTSGGLIGSVTVNGNGIRSVDQYIGLASDVPFARFQFDNVNANGESSRLFAVAIDDLKFSSIPQIIPEPSSFALAGLAAVVATMVARRRVRR
jgi:hypothetical protein